ncbi:alpha/beta fold hydrolase [Paenibacillaceae bacterium WGS1546]|uniref:alpha/beta fold hydrolase n=1 Tax=Cohnella sp. WGS1546 TaxID=3366810 RepID=UPI00372D67DB
MNIIETGTMAAACEERGEGEPIVLLHGYCGSRLYWEDTLPPLSSVGRAIAPDLRGHGASSASERGEDYGMDSLADDLAALLDALGLERAHVFGHSLGGYVALAFAEKHPERLLSLGLVHSTAYPDAEQAKDNRLKAAAAIREQGVAAFVDGLVPKLFAAENRNARPELVAKAREIGYGTSEHGAAGCALGMRARPDRVGVLERLEKPVLLLAGELDEVIPPERRFPVAKPNVESVTLAGVGHMGMMENPQAFAAAIAAFLDRNRRAGRV